ncbi:MAG: 50S ribosomal protein L25 [Deltaproteobacteria bacterium]|nr:50S ribosomal protein L25 [Deltaproteobacteria bacterium]
MPQMTDTIEAQPRLNCGKGATHKIRKAGQIPAIAYGPNLPTRLLALDPHIFGLQRQQYGSSHVYDVKVEGDSIPFKALIREIQIDPYTQNTLHVDLYALDMKKPIHVDVHVELIGKPAGLLAGGILQQIVRRLEVECLPTAIPENITVDVSALDIGNSIKASELTLPEGVKVHGRLDQTIATMVAAEEESTPQPAAEAAVVEGAVATAAAPAAVDKGEVKEDKAKK